MVNNDIINNRYFGEVNSIETTFNTRERIHWICKRVKGKKIMDVGCSQGIISILLAREGFSVLGIDIESEAIDYAKKELEKESELVIQNVEFRKVDITNDVKDLGEFDTIIVGEVLEHFAHPERALINIYKLLKHNGRVIITVPFGFLNFHDHKQTFYILNFVKTVYPFFNEVELFIKNKILFFVGEKRELLKKQLDIEELEINKLINLIEEEEIIFKEIEKKYTIKDLEKTRRINKLNEKIKKFEAGYKKDYEKSSQIVDQVTEVNLKKLDELLDRINIEEKLENILGKSKLIHNDVKVLKKEKTIICNKYNKVLNTLLKTRQINNILKKEINNLKNQNINIVNKTYVLDDVNKKLDNIINNVEEISQNKIIKQDKKEIVNFKKQIDKLAKEKNNLQKKYNKTLKSLLNSRKTIENIKTNSSLRYKIGDEIVNSRHSIKKIMKLPYKLYKLYKQKDMKKNNINYTEKDLDNIDKVLDSKRTITENVVRIKSSRDAILFMPTNGAGLGHLTRTLAIARRVKRIDSEKEIIFLSTSPAMHLVLNEGFLGYHIPSKMVCPSDMTANQWNNLLKTHLKYILNLHDIKTVVFDGAYPYAGLITTMKEFENVRKIWVKRGQAKNNTEDIRKEKEKYFDKIIIPGEIVENKRFLSGDKYFNSNPIIYLDKEELLDRDEVRRMWNIPDNKKLVYVQLGAGNIDDINSTLGMVMNELKKREDVIIVLGESIIGKRLNIDLDNLIIIRDYPNSRYFKAFDLAISAVGYNTFHELLYFNVPSIFIPNMKTKTDDQLGRAKYAEKFGAAIILENVCQESIQNAIHTALKTENNINMKENSLKVEIKNGAEEVAKHISI